MKWWEARCIFLSAAVDFEIKCHLLIKRFLRFCKAGWYVVMKGRIFFLSLFFCKADFSSVNSTSEVISSMRLRVTSSAKAFFEVLDVLIGGFCWGVCSQKSKGLAFYETFSDPVRVTGRKMRVFKSLRRFKMCVDLKDSLVVKSLAFVNSCKHLLQVFPWVFTHSKILTIGFLTKTAVSEL